MLTFLSAAFASARSNDAARAGSGDSAGLFGDVRYQIINSTAATVGLGGDTSQYQHRQHQRHQHLHHHAHQHYQHNPTQRVAPVTAVVTGQVPFPFTRYHAPPNTINEVSFCGLTAFLATGVLPLMGSGTFDVDWTKPRPDSNTPTNTHPRTHDEDEEEEEEEDDEDEDEDEDEDDRSYKVVGQGLTHCPASRRC
ncbi:unnamed protein product [Schistocephalus solidus]|uniref:Secreted protein n=1 Tax=Schistocephalus solidus TaxID=70667 RepID=A0A183T0S7_SCHSO|nr:unnamed protein product [Schistocephalus solidus]